MERLAFNAGYQGMVAGVDEVPPQPPSAVPDSQATEAVLERRDQAAFGGLLAFTTVLFVRPQDSLPILEPLHLADLTASFALLALIGGRLGRGRALFRPSTELLLVAAMGGVMLATAPFSVWPGGSVSLFTDTYVKVILIFALLIETVTTRSRFERFVNIVVIGSSYIAVRAVIDYGRGVNLHEGGRVGGAVSGLFGNPNDLALNMVSFLPLTIPLALHRGGPTMRRLLGTIALPAMAATIVFTKSRGGFVALGVMLVVLLYQLRRVRPGIAAMVIAASFASIPFLPDTFIQRMHSIINPEGDPYPEGDAYGSREARKRLLRDAYQAFLENPLFGLGAGQFMNYRPDERQEPWRETHNAVMQVAAELGAGGLAIFVSLIVIGLTAGIRATAALRRIRRGRKRARAPDPSRRPRELLELYSAAMVASVMGWFAAAMFASVAYYWTFYIVLGLAVALREIIMRETKGAVVVRRKPIWLQAA